MTLLLISTSWRHTSYNQPSGRLLVFDTKERKMVKSCKIVEPPYREFDPNPRGGFRGLKGISIFNDQIALANASTIFIYDHKWNPIKYIWHPSCAGIHDILLQSDRIWATSSRNDLVFCFDLQGNILKFIDVRKAPFIKHLQKNQPRPFLSESQIAKGKINFRDPRTHDHAITDRLHINSFSILNNGEYLISCGLLRVIDAAMLHKLNNLIKRTPFSRSLSKTYALFTAMKNNNHRSNFEDKTISKESSSSFIIRQSPEESVKICLSLNNCHVPSHSVRILDDNSAIYLNSSSGEILHFSPDSCEIFSKSKIGMHFLRGACQLDDGSLFIGDNSDLIQYDLINKVVISRTHITENKAEAIFDVHKLTNNFSLPPLSFPKLHLNKMPIRQE